MPKEVRVVDKTMRKDPSTGKMIKNENYRNDFWNVKYTTVKKGDVVRKRITGDNFEAIRQGKPVSEKSVKIEKFDKSGKLKRTIDISDGKKVISVPGKDSVTKKANFIDRARFKKNI